MGGIAGSWWAEKKREQGRGKSLGEVQFSTGGCRGGKPKKSPKRERQVQRVREVEMLRVNGGSRE